MSKTQFQRIVGSVIIILLVITAITIITIIKNNPHHRHHDHHDRAEKINAIDEILQEIASRDEGLDYELYKQTFYSHNDIAENSTKATKIKINIPIRLQKLYEKKEIIGDDGFVHMFEQNLDVRDIFELRKNYGGKSPSYQRDNDKTSIMSAREIDDDDNDTRNVPASLMVENLTKNNLDNNVTIMDDIINYLEVFLQKLSDQIEDINGEQKGDRRILDVYQKWNRYFKLASETIYKWDQNHYLAKVLQLIPKRNDDSIFISIVSYKDDEACFNTLQYIFGHAASPERVNIGLVLQRSNTTSSNSNEIDCFESFCKDNGKIYCDNHQIRLIRTKSTRTSLGPYFCRFFASKLWSGEQWYIQIDSHMTFEPNWDDTLISTLKNAPSKKAVLSQLPYPRATNDFKSKDQNMKDNIIPKVCGVSFSTGLDDGQIIELNTIMEKDLLSESNDSIDNQFESLPVLVAGFFIAPSEVLHEVPFDPFLPFLLKGEEILISSRLWTSGYDIFHTRNNVVGHIYRIDRANASYNQKSIVIDNEPHIWWKEVETSFNHYGIFDLLQLLVLDRVKHQLGYPESERDMLRVKTLLGFYEKYSTGSVRSLESYMKFAGLDVMTKTSTKTWC